MISSQQKAYLAGFIDGDGSIYVRAKPNSDYRYGYQIAPYMILFQSAKNRILFEQLCALIPFGTMRERKDGILEYTINRVDDIEALLTIIAPYAIMKHEQIKLMRAILKKKQEVKSETDFAKLLKLVDAFRELNYSKKRKKRVLTP